MSTSQPQVIATFSRRMRLRLDDGNEIEARVKGKRMRPVCGDAVIAEPIPNESDWLITAIEDRRNALTRPNLRGDVEVLAANVDQLVVVAAPQLVGGRKITEPADLLDLPENHRDRVMAACAAVSGRT